MHRLRDAVIVLVAAVCGLFLRLWAIVLLWGWFAVPVFGVPPVTMAVAFGLAMIGGLLVPARRLETGDIDVSKDVGAALGPPLGALVFGYLVARAAGLA